MTRFITRRAAMISGLAGSGFLLAGCDRLSANAGFRHLMEKAEDWTRVSQRLLLSGQPLAREFKPSDISHRFRANGTTMPDSDEYAQHMEEGFANWRVRIDGLVTRPLSLSLADLQRLPARTQITRHDCVEGWSAIGQWTGVPLGPLLKTASLLPHARYAVFHCADDLEGGTEKGGEESPGQYYESIALIDAVHPQTILAYALNAQPLDVAHGAPVRLRIERQLGYKHAKYVERIQITDRLAGIHGGKGGYWEDRGYEWYAGI